MKTNSKAVQVASVGMPEFMAGLHGIVVAIAKMVKEEMGGPALVAKKVGRRAANKTAKKVHRKPCIATGCKKVSKGPRFHFCCEEHRDAPAKTIKAWKKAKE
jgi:uncharacterized protein (DUF1800 family)